MKLRTLICGLAAVPTLFACCNQPANSTSELETSTEASTVSISSGQICGFIDNGVYVYKGIPYAKAERFQEPQTPDSWEGIRSCRAFGPTAPQDFRTGWNDDKSAFAYDWNDGFPGEDCLRVNVWTNGINDGQKRPVMVWLHGGGFSAGSGQEQPAYDGASLARNHNVVVVTLNHRLNVLGYLDLSAFGEEYAHSGNLGMMDIVKALEWVRDNAESFGGDAGNVTIFGQSGGGGKVCTILSMPSAKGLFNKAIVQSGSITHVMDTKYSQMLGNETVKELGLNAKTIGKIKTVPYAELFAAQERARVRVVEAAKAEGVFPENILFQLIFGTEPTVDGDILPYHPDDARAIEINKDIPVMIGSTMHEFIVGTDDFIFRPSTDAQVAERINAGCAPVYHYLFKWCSPVLDGSLGCCHCMDIPFVFDNAAVGRTMTGGGDYAIELGHRVGGLWTSFAKNGVPTAKGAPTWNPSTITAGVISEPYAIE